MSLRFRCEINYRCVITVCKNCLYFRRIAYQENTQTFGVLTLRVDIQEHSGPTPMRASASVNAQATSQSAAPKSMSLPTSNAELQFGDEVEMHSLLVLDQHTFEGELRPSHSLLFSSLKIFPCSFCNSIYFSLCQIFMYMS